jgi:hypothetical protein
MHVRCRGNPFTKQLPSESPETVDVFIARYLETDVCLSSYCIATAVLVVRFEVSAQQRHYGLGHVHSNLNHVSSPELTFCTILY